MGITSADHIRHLFWRNCRGMADLVVHLDYGRPGLEHVTFADGWEGYAVLPVETVHIPAGFHSYRWEGMKDVRKAIASRNPVQIFYGRRMVHPRKKIPFPGIKTHTPGGETIRFYKYEYPEGKVDGY